MFGFNKKPQKGEQAVLEIEGMHCSSCAMTIDGELEDTQGVISANTSFAKSQTTVTFDPNKVSVDQLSEVVSKQGYKARVKA